MEPVGLVLAGGGGKAAYQIGVWKALKELGIVPMIHCVSGASAGALNTVLFAHGDYALAEKIWQEVTPSRFLSVDEKSFLSFIGYYFVCGSPIPAIITSILRNGTFSREGLLEVIDANMDLTQLQYSDTKAYVNAYNVTETKLEYFPLNGKTQEEIKTILLASSALPVAYGTVTMGKSLYLDGGLPIIGDIMPIKPLYDQGIRHFILVDLKKGDVETYQKKFPDCHFIYLCPSQYQGGLMEGTLDFSKTSSMARMQLGYEDALAFFNKSKEETPPSAFVQDFKQYARIHRDMTLEEQFPLLFPNGEALRLFCTKTIGFPNIKTHTLGGHYCWSTCYCIDGWKIQKNAFTRHYRILDPQNIRHGWLNGDMFLGAMNQIEG